jgi:hypothetical protein
MVLLVDFKENVGLVRERDLHLVLRGLKDFGRLTQGDLALVFSLVLVIFELPVLKELTIAYLLVKPAVLFQEVAP